VFVGLLLRSLRVVVTQTGEKLISHALSPNGKMIACADTEAVKIFRIDEKKSGRHGFGEDVRFSVQKMEIPNAELAAWYVSSSSSSSSRLLTSGGPRACAYTTRA
jgi:hypothetical protein